MMRSSLLLLTILSTVCFSFNVHASADEANFLKKAAEQYMLAQFPKDGPGRLEAQSGKIDEKRNYGGRCEGYLTAQLVGKRITRNSQVKLSCSNPQNKWDVIVPVTVRRLIPTVTASTNLPRRTLIEEQMLQESWVDSELNTQAAVTDASLLIGSRLKRDIKSGEQIKNGDYCMVCRGDNVTIEAQTANLAVKTQGIAMADGNLGDQIQVRNIKSRRLISAIVSSSGTVKVGL